MFWDIDHKEYKNIILFFLKGLLVIIINNIDGKKWKKSAIIYHIFV